MKYYRSEVPAVVFYLLPTFAGNSTIMPFRDATATEIDLVMQEAWKAFHQYRKLSLKERAGFMRAIAAVLDEQR